jgi:uncharacterized membrane protein
VLFLTRWITHLCAPTFAVATGLGASLWIGRHGEGLARHLLLRGLWLILLELFVVRFAYFWGWLQGSVILSVLWSLGVFSMILLAALNKVPRKNLLLVAVAILLAHWWVESIAGASPAARLRMSMPAVFQVAGVPVISGYPIVPWQRWCCSVLPSRPGSSAGSGTGTAKWSIGDWRCWPVPVHRHPHL